MITVHDLDLMESEPPRFIGRVFKCWSCLYVFVFGEVMKAEAPSHKLPKEPNFCPRCGRPAKEIKES